jgi:Asp-tRNA(Asn)/Glu-tRNA(Gln) amidotransferase C subunit
MTDTTISIDDVHYIAALSKVAVSDDEAAKLSVELDRILSYVRQLDDLVPHQPYLDASHPQSAAPGTSADLQHNYGYASDASDVPGATACDRYVHQDRVGGVLDTTGVEPTYQVTGLANVDRVDEVIDYGISQQALLQNAPRTQDNQIKVPKVL